MLEISRALLMGATGLVIVSLIINVVVVATRHRKPVSKAARKPVAVGRGASHPVSPLSPAEFDENPNPAVAPAPQPAAPNLRGERVPRFGKLLYKPQGLESFDQKSITQPWCLLCIPGNGFVQLCLCWLQQADVHVRWAAAEYFAITSDKATALIPPRR